MAPVQSAEIAIPSVPTTQSKKTLMDMGLLLILTTVRDAEYALTNAPGGL